MPCALPAPSSLSLIFLFHFPISMQVVRLTAVSTWTLQPEVLFCLCTGHGGSGLNQCFHPVALNRWWIGAASSLQCLLCIDPQCSWEDWAPVSCRGDLLTSHPVLQDYLPNKALSPDILSQVRALLLGPLQKDQKCLSLFYKMRTVIAPTLEAQCVN